MLSRLERKDGDRLDRLNHPRSLREEGECSVNR